MAELGTEGVLHYLFMTRTSSESYENVLFPQKIVLNCLLQLSHNQSLWQIWGFGQYLLWMETMVFP